MQRRSPGKASTASAVQDSLPPDPNGAAGLSQYVQIVNESFQVFSKSGASLYGPVPHEHALHRASAATASSTTTVTRPSLYDHLADRWVISQFSVSISRPRPIYQCVAVSATLGRDRRLVPLRVPVRQFPDYPKLGVWPDAYYETYNLFFDAPAFHGPEVCAYDRAAMLHGDWTRRQQC